MSKQCITLAALYAQKGEIQTTYRANNQHKITIISLIILTFLHMNEYHKLLSAN